MKVLHKIIGYIFVVTLAMVLFMGFIANLAMDDIKENASEKSTSVLIDQETKKLHNLVLDKAHINEVFMEDMIEITKMMSSSFSQILDKDVYLERKDGGINISGYRFINGSYSGAFTGSINGFLDCSLNGTLGKVERVRQEDPEILDQINTTFITGHIDADLHGSLTIPPDVFLSGTYDGATVNWTDREVDIDGSFIGDFGGNDIWKDAGGGYDGKIDGSIRGLMTGAFGGSISGSIDIQSIAVLDGELNGICDSSPEIIESILISIDDNDLMIDSAYMCGRTSWHSLNEGRSIFTSSSHGFLGYNPMKRDWYRTTIEQEGTYITSPYIDATGMGRMVTIGSPIRRGGEIIGVSAVDVTIKNVVEKMISISSYETGSAYLIDPEGYLIVAEELDCGDTQWFDRIEQVDLSEIRDPDFSSLLERILIGENGVEELDIDIMGYYNSTACEGHSHGPTFTPGIKFLAFAPINSTGWRLLITVEEDEVLSPAAEMSDTIDRSAEREMKSFLFFSFMLLTISLMVGSFIGYQLMKPLEELTVEMGHVGIRKNTMELRHSNKNDEVGKLTRSFEDMNARLARLMGELEYEIEERKKKESEADKERKRAEFYLDLLGHDIGNLHQSIYSALQVAEIRKDDSVVREKALGMAGGSIRRSMTLIRNINLLSRVWSKKSELEPIDIVPLIKKAIRDMDSMFPTKTIKVDLKMLDRKLEVMAEPIIDTVMINLLHNSIKFQTEEEARLNIKVEKDRKGKVARVSISDRGCGVSDKMKQKIFARFRSGREQRMTGSGLGLHIVSELVSRYNGKIRVVDRVKGDHTKGAKFIVEIPLA